MSRHIPLLCGDRDPFFRDWDRDVFGDRLQQASRASSYRGGGEAPSKLVDQNFATGLWPDDSGSSSLYFRSRRNPREKSGSVTLMTTKEKFSVLLEVPQFTPDELKVRVAGNLLEVEGKHEERADEHGMVSRHFIRKYELPEDTMVERINSSLGADGVLSVEAPRKPPEPPRPSEREVPIQKMQEKSTSRDMNF